MKPIISHEVFLTSRRDLKNDHLLLGFGPFPGAASIKPGQFVHIGFRNPLAFYRRAFSIAGVNTVKREIEIILKVIGRGSYQLSQLRAGEGVNFLGPLGNPFVLPGKRQTALMVAGGVGYPPLLFLAMRMIERGYDPKNIVFFYGGRSSEDIVDRARIRKLGVRFLPATQNGSFGERGMITALLKRFLSTPGSAGSGENVIFACGPEGLLEAVDRIAAKFETPGQLALEAPMPCGFGICLGCVVPLKSGGFARVCKEGPVFDTGTLAL